MKKIFVLLFLLLSVQSYGVYGAIRAKALHRECTVALGPLCYAWSETSADKFKAKALSDKIEKAVEKTKADAKEIRDQASAGAEALRKQAEDFREKARSVAGEIQQHIPDGKDDENDE